MTKPTGRPLGRPKTKEYETLMARVPQELADRARRYAGLHQQPISVVLREGLELLLEEDRYRPFMSDRNEGEDIVSDRNGDDHAPAAPRHSPDIVSDRNGDGRDPAIHTPLPAILSDIKAAQGTPKPAPAFLSDSNSPTFDTSKYTLGKLCPRQHEHGTTGQSLLRITNRHCLACDREKFHERTHGRGRTTRAAPAAQGSDDRPGVRI